MHAYRYLQKKSFQHPFSMPKGFLPTAPLVTALIYIVRHYIFGEVLAPLSNIDFSLVFLFATWYVQLISVSIALSPSPLFERYHATLLLSAPVSLRPMLIMRILRLLLHISIIHSITMVLFFGALMPHPLPMANLLLLIGIVMLGSTALVLLSLVIHTHLMGNPTRKKVTKSLSFIIYIPILVVYALRIFGLVDFNTAFHSVLQSSLFTCIPIIGWGTGSVFALQAGNAPLALLFVGLLIAFAIAMFAMILKSPYNWAEGALYEEEVAIPNKGRRVQ